MKKLLLAAAAVTTLVTSADAALKKGDLAVDFTLNDIKGNQQHLFAYLDSGYTVIIDESAAWCGPCWSMHQSGQFNNLIAKYGPAGTVSAKKIMVIFIEGESTNTTAQLYGPAASTGSYATTTQGDWVSGENYPFIDNPPTNVRNAYLDGGFPTFTVIGRDRIVYDQFAGYSSTMGTEAFWTKYLTTAPNYGPSTTTDAKIVDYTISDVFLCNANPKIRFQNYGNQTITSATLKVLSGSTTIATQNWTGSLTKYATQDVQMPTFSQAGPYKFEVTVTGDANAANNSLTVTNLNVIAASQATTAPYVQDFQSAGTAIPTKFVLDGNGGDMYGMSAALSSGGVPITVIGSNNQATNCLAVLYQNNAASFKSEVMLGNYNTATASAPTFAFDLAYQAKATAATDKLELLSSIDCGATWQSAWVGTGSTLVTKPGVPSSFFLPAAGGDWATKTAPLPKNNNLFLKFVATTSPTGSPSYAWIDNFNVSTTTAVDDVIAKNSISIYPNPTTDAATLQFDAIKATSVSIQVVDLTGRVVANVANENVQAGSRKFTINTANLPSGIYNVKIQTESGSQTQRLSVVK
ncbi:MAG TPA: T9SS type A sorting domain-containing protein [Flavipsychrobacter sp.]|nr:T9SS type A sorting domain-containing protein [Flavipsychrobacter sp.]